MFLFSKPGETPIRYLQVTGELVSSRDKPSSYQVDKVHFFSIKVKSPKTIEDYVKFFDLLKLPIYDVVSIFLKNLYTVKLRYYIPPWDRPKVYVIAGVYNIEVRLHN